MSAFFFSAYMSWLLAPLLLFSWFPLPLVVGIAAVLQLPLILCLQVNEL